MFSHKIRLRVFAWVFLRIVASCCLRLFFSCITVVRNETEEFLLGRFFRFKESTSKIQIHVVSPQGTIKYSESLELPSVSRHWRSTAPKPNPAL